MEGRHFGLLRRPLSILIMEDIELPRRESAAGILSCGFILVVINTHVSQPLTDVQREDLVRALGRHQTTGSNKAQIKKGKSSAWR